MWQPDPGWQRLPGGPSSQGVWLATEAGQRLVVKRLAAPPPDDAGHHADPADVSWWRREAEVARSGDLAATPGVRSAAVVDVTEDPEGITLRQVWVPEADNTGPQLARALGRFAGSDVPDRPWQVRGLLRQRLQLVERRDGWRALARTTAADLADHLWRRRATLLDSLDALPQVPQHGDPVPANLLGRADEAVVAVDWATYGRGPVGADLGYLSLTARENFEVLLDAYAAGLPAGLAARDDVLLGARVMAVYTALTRADWALARVADGEGALAGRLRHPSVAPYLRSLQRQLPQIEALLE